MGWSGVEGREEFVICFCVVRHPERMNETVRGIVHNRTDTDTQLRTVKKLGKLIRLQVNF